MNLFDPVFTIPDKEVLILSFSLTSLSFLLLPEHKVSNHVVPSHHPRIREFDLNLQIHLQV